MAGRARYQALTDELTKRCRDYFEDDTDSTPLDYVCARIESGTVAKAIAQELQDALPFDVDYGMLMRYLRHQHGAERADSEVDAARMRASHSWAEESIILVDAPADTSSEVARAGSRARSRQWMAQAWNPSRYGQQKGVSVNVSIGSLHLDALRATSRIVTGASQPQLSTPVDVEHEVI